MSEHSYRVTPTNSATNGGMEYYVDLDFATSSTSSWSDMPDRWNPMSASKLVKREITLKQEKMIRKEIKIWMDDHLKKSIEKEAGKLLKDIENLKEEKTKLGKAISSLKQEMRRTKKEVQEEMASFEIMLEKYANQILRYQNMDL